jgi:hypothetical protein
MSNGIQAAFPFSACMGTGKMFRKEFYEKDSCSASKDLQEWFLRPAITIIIAPPIEGEVQWITLGISTRIS